MKKLRIYIASSWKQEEQVRRLAVYLRDQIDIIEEVYDFTDSKSGAAPFSWSDITDKLASFSISDYEKLRHHPVAEKAYQQDMYAMERADICILLLPAGASAHSEAGWFAGKGKPVIVISPVLIQNIELMYNMYSRVIGDVASDRLYAKLTTYLDSIARQEVPKYDMEQFKTCPVKTDNVLAAISPRTQVLVKTEGGRIGYVELDHVRALINPESKESEKENNLAEVLGTIMAHKAKEGRLLDELIAAVNSLETKV